MLGVMQKDGKRFAGTGGWGFEGFARRRPSPPGDKIADLSDACKVALANSAAGED